MSEAAGGLYLLLGASAQGSMDSKVNKPGVDKWITFTYLLSTM